MGEIGKTFNVFPSILQEILKSPSLFHSFSLPLHNNLKRSRVTD